MMADNIYDKSGRVRKARTHIRLDVEKGDAEPDNELPFVVGVMGDYSGNDSGLAKQPLRDRKFVPIDRFTFDSVMAGIAPGLKIQVQDTEREDEATFEAQLSFRTMNDFSPARVAEQIPQLKAMLEQREALKSLLAKLGSDPKVGDFLEEILSSTEKREKFLREVGRLAGEDSGS